MDWVLDDSVELTLLGDCDNGMVFMLVKCLYHADWRICGWNDAYYYL